MRGESLEELPEEKNVKLPQIKLRTSTYGAILVRSNVVEAGKRKTTKGKQSFYIFNNIDNIHKSLATTNSFTD